MSNNQNRAMAKIPASNQAKENRGGYRTGSGRKALDKRILSTRIDAHVLADLRKYAKSSGIPQAVIIEDALKDYFTKNKK
jgi:hypothetical protein